MEMKSRVLSIFGGMTMKPLIIGTILTTISGIILAVFTQWYSTQQSISTNVPQDPQSQSTKQSSTNISQDSQPTQQSNDIVSPSYDVPKQNTNQVVGTLQVNINGTNKTYTTTLPFDNKIRTNGVWSVLFDNRDSIYIILPSDVKAGHEFSAEDGALSTSSWGPPSFGFVYKDKSSNSSSLISDTNSFDSFGLIIDKWEGRGGYAEGRFSAEIRPLIGDTIIMKNGSFKIQIRN